MTLRVAVAALPAASATRPQSVWLPSTRPAAVYGDAHGEKLAASTRHVTDVGAPRSRTRTSASRRR
ncbi:MAG: hypothetical protein H6709_08560 [Kofleriaceae bacterium]|nr:hypothetical protein [Kofleriaceae bacterium]